MDTDDDESPGGDMNLYSNLINKRDLPFDSRIEIAIQEWSKILPMERIIRQTSPDYTADTIVEERIIPVALKVASREEIVEIVKIAAALRIPLYPISTGKNWGYGTANPVQNKCVVLDMALMNRIIEVNDELSWVKLEPGVTQQQLFDYLEERNLKFMVPTTGAGPACSILGNLLERGYGITPHMDHFGALLGLEAILPNGELYQSALEECAGSEINQAFKWGVGPYLDGLFSQSNFGVVTSATIALQKRPECHEVFVFRITSDEQLPGAVEAVREIIATLGSTVGGINLMNANRVLSMTAPYPRDLIPEGQTMSDEMVGRLARQYHIAAWTGVGAIYGDRTMVKAAKKVIKKILRRHTRQLVFVSPRLASILRGAANLLVKIFPKSVTFPKRIQAMSDNVSNLLQITIGKPNEVALPLAYLKSGKLPVSGKSFDPAKDGCGLMWYSPLVPMIPEKVLEYVWDTKRICQENGIEPLITLTTISERCFDSTVPILFDRGSKADTQRARQCYDQLLRLGRIKGIFPYRFAVDHMNQLGNEHSVFWKMAAKIKAALDPNGIVSPGRYEVIKPKS